MPFTITHHTMESTISCALCSATLNVCTDDRRTIDRSFQKFQNGHKCRNTVEHDRQSLPSKNTTQ